MARVVRCPICYTHVSVGVHGEKLSGCPMCGAYLLTVETVQAHLIPIEVKEVLSDISMGELKGVASSLKLSSIGGKETVITRLLLEEMPRAILLNLTDESLLSILKKRGLPTDKSRDIWVTRIISSFEHRDQIPFTGEPATKRGRESKHDEIGQKIVELGEMQGLDATVKYRYEDKIYDVIWKKKVPNASPSHVFEVQIGGNLNDALMRLKHAHDLWNSKVFLISTEKDLNKAERSLSGALHEIQDYAETVLVDELDEYYQVKKRIAALDLKLK